MTVGQLISATEPLKKILECSLPVKISFRLAKFINDVQPALTAYEDARIKLVQSLGSSQEDGSWTLDTPESKQNFADELKELMQEKINCEAPTLKLDDLNGVTLTPTECSSIVWLIEE